jgi:hypothetical protein
MRQSKAFWSQPVTGAPSPSAKRQMRRKPAKDVEIWRVTTNPLRRPRRRASLKGPFMIAAVVATVAGTMGHATLPPGTSSRAAYAPAAHITSASCNIKGNISARGERIYHMPDQKYYAKTIIDHGAGERWFCSEAEAPAEGWRKSKV